MSEKGGRWVHGQYLGMLVEQISAPELGPTGEAGDTEETDCELEDGPTPIS